MSESEAPLKENDSAVQSLSLQLMQQRELNTELESQLAAINRQLLATRKEKIEFETRTNEFRQQLVEKTNLQLKKSSEEVTALREEIEQLSEALFTEANLQVETAKKSQWDIKQLNDKLATTLDTKDNTIEMLEAEMDSLKALIADLQSQLDVKHTQVNQGDQFPPPLRKATTAATSCIVSNSVKAQLPDDALFETPSLLKFNNIPINLSFPTFNQLRLDLPYALHFKEALFTSNPESWSIKSTKLYEIVLNEVDACVRLDKSPALRYKFNKRSVLSSLLEYKAGIEPLSAATESWKKSQLDKSVNNGITTAIQAQESSTIKVPQPLAIQDPCTMCGEKRTTMNSARLYKMTIFKKEKETYNLCINCASKWRVVIPLMSFVSQLKPFTDKRSQSLPDNNELYFPHLDKLWSQYFQLISYFIELSYLKYGIWEENDVCGVVYGWKNLWIGKCLPQQSQLGRSTINSTDISLEKGDSTDSFVSASNIPLPLEKSRTSDSVTNPLSKTVSSTSRSTSVSQSSELINPKGASKGVDLRVVSGSKSNAKRRSVNLNVLLNAASSPKNKDDGEDEEEEEEEEEGEGEGEEEKREEKKEDDNEEDETVLTGGLSESVLATAPPGTIGQTDKDISIK